MRNTSMITLLILLFSCTVLNAQETNDEWRATWTITRNYGMAGASVDAQKARIREILDNHQKANMNAVLWQVRQSGTAYYNSSYEPWGYYVGSSYPGFDPLAYAVKEAHKRGMEIHAWFNAFHASSEAAGTPVYEHPEWVCRDGYGNPMTSSYALSPGLEAVRDYTLQVAMEVVNNYDVDGLHLDYIRWNEYTTSQQSQDFAQKARDERFLDGMITEEQVQELQRVQPLNRYLYDVNHPYSDTPPDGFDSWEDWWRWSVTTFVHDLHDSIQTVKPWVRLSVAALGNYNWGGWQGYGTVFQDAALWFNEGYIEQLTPMHYHWTSGSAFYAMLTGSDAESWQPNIQQGINAGRLFTVGPPSYILADNVIWGRHPGIVNSCREVSWTDGFQFFSYGSWESYNYWDAAAQTFFAKKTKVRDTGLIDDVAPGAPSLAMEKVDSLHYALTVTPSTSLGNDNWFAVYRSEDNAIDVDADAIVAIHFGDSTFAVVDSFTGLQDYDDSYYYAVTELDRYWNESPVSNVGMSDPIPSFAPIVTETTPMSGDTIPVNQSLQITFSKTMDTTAVNSSINANPAIDFTEIIWDADLKTATLISDGDFAYGTQYTLTVAATAADVNGRALDGNADGVAGDDFTMEFYTLEIDNTGPELADSYPAEEPELSEFDVDNVISFYFDEMLDPSSVNESNIQLLRDEEPVEHGFNLTTIDNQSVLSIQPLASFEQNTSYTVNILNGITDTLGNSMENTISRPFTTSEYGYAEINYITTQFTTSDWKDPEWSGSTVGTIDPNTYFDNSTEAWLPNAPTRQRVSGKLHYEWNTGAEEHLLRMYLFGATPRSVTFDSSYVLQLYVFGDGSNTKFRFALDDGTTSQTDHEVSHWVPIDWVGWRLVEWDLGDPNGFGDWIGNHTFNQPNNLRFDSIQLTYSPDTSYISGTIYLDDLRLVKKTTDPVRIDQDMATLPVKVSLHQNYPNPFNPTTNVIFELPSDQFVKLTVYNTLGQEVTTLVNRKMTAGIYQVTFDGSHLSSGIYIYRLVTGETQINKRMLLIK